jgi:glycolate dehydrogenase FAD-binding subunit
MSIERPSSATIERVRPADARACAEALRRANDARQTVRLRGGGTKDYLGDPMPADLVIETTALEGIVEHVPADLTVTVAAGTRFRALEDVLARAGQMLALDPPHADAATIGGIVSANSSGFRRARYGGVRDLLIGTTSALVDGTVARAGGRVVKNVAGYDVNKLLIGSLGTLAVITECTFKVTPLPVTSAGLRARFRRAADAYAAADLIARTPARPAALAIDGTARDAWELLVLAEGERAAVTRTLALASDAASSRGTAEPADVTAALTEMRELPATADGVVVRASLPSAAQTVFAEAATRLEGFARLVSDAASGIARVHVRGEDHVLIAAADSLLADARVCGGSARVERRPDRLRARVGAWGDGDVPGLFLMRRLKEAFDPNGILEPGRSVVA